MSDSKQKSKTSKAVKATPETEMKIAAQILDDKLARQISVIDVRKVTSLCDYFLICSGESTVQLKAIAEELQYKFKHDLDILPISVEGYPDSSWILIDFGDIIIHLFLEDSREFYRLERLWGQGEFLEISEIIPGYREE